MKILVLSNSSGGLYNFRKELWERLVESGCEVILCVPDNKRKDEFEKIGCKYIVIPMKRRSMNPINDIALIYSYYKLLKAFKPDVVLTYTIKPNIYGGIVCRVTNIPYISTITGLGTTIENPGVLRALVVTLYKIGLKKSSAVIFQNNSNQKIFENLNIGKNYYLVAGSGVNINIHCFEKYPPENSDIHMIYVGRIMIDKGIKELLEAANIIKTKYPKVQFDMIGSFDDSLQSAVNKAINSGEINYYGYQKEMHEFYQKAWAIIMPSYHEGMSNVCLEAASTGRPLLASRVPGCQETYDDGISGIGFEAKSTSAIVEAIEKFLSMSYDEKATMGINGRKKMENEFDRELVISRYMNIISNVLKVK